MSGHNGTLFIFILIAEDFLYVLSLHPVWNQNELGIGENMFSKELLKEFYHLILPIHYVLRVISLIFAQNAFSFQEFSTRSN